MKTNKRKNTLALLKSMMPYFMKYKGILIFDLICASLTTVCELLLPMIARYITDLGASDPALLSVRIILTVGITYVVIRIIDGFANYFMASIGHIMGTKIETDMRRDMFNHLQKLPNAFYDETKVGHIMSRIGNDLFDITEFAHHCPEEIFISGIKIVASFAICLSMNVKMTLVLFSVVPVMLVFAIGFNKAMKRTFRESRVQIAELNAQVEDSLSGIRVVKSFANEAIEEGKFNDGNLNFLDIKKRMYYYMAGYQTSTRVFHGIMYSIILILGAFMIKDSSLRPADLTAYLLYVAALINSIRKLVDFTEQFQKGITGMERFREIMDEPAKIFDNDGTVELKDVKGEIEFKNVSFNYDKTTEMVLDDISFKVKAGEVVALVGPSGGGKTTICNLIPRFYEVSDGEITLDKRNIKDYTLESLRNNIGVVQQDVYLFCGTVAENIEYGKPGASREEIIEAARLAGAHDFIMGLENGYDTYVGERGVKLSGGQKQRISIARVFLKDPPILILDEATSALDNESERLVQQSLEKLAKGRTTIIVAHRLTTIRNASKIIVLTQEGIAEEGSHKELMEKGGLYWRLYNMYVEMV